MSGMSDADATKCLGGPQCNYGAAASSLFETAIILRNELAILHTHTLPPHQRGSIAAWVTLYVYLCMSAGWNEVLTHMSPNGWGFYGIAFGLGLSVVGAAWGIWLTGSCLVGSAVKAPRIRSKNLIRCLACATSKILLFARA
jgi:hypothetical protein